MKAKIAWASAIALSTLCALYGGGALGESIGPASTGISIMLGEKDDGRVITARVGQPVHLSLPENASTGYRWVVEQLDTAAVELSTHDAAYPHQTPGSAGLALFSFRPIRPGSTEVILKQWRQWEGDTAATRRFRLLLDITP